MPKIITQTEKQGSDARQSTVLPCSNLLGRNLPSEEHAMALAGVPIGLLLLSKVKDWKTTEICQREIQRQNADYLPTLIVLCK